MTRCKYEALAKLLAAENKASYGFSVLDGWFYIGTPDQLSALACVDVKGGAL